MKRKEVHPIIACFVSMFFILSLSTCSKANDELVEHMTSEKHAAYEAHADTTNKNIENSISVDCPTW